MAERTFSRRQLVGLYPPFSQTLPIGILDGYRLVVADDHVNATLWWDDGPNDILAIPISKMMAEMLLGMPETKTGAIPDNFVAKDGASPAEYLLAKCEEMKDLAHRLGGVTDYMTASSKECQPMVDLVSKKMEALRKYARTQNEAITNQLRRKHAICEEKPPVVPGAACPEPTTFRFTGDKQAALPDSGDPLTAWPKCHVCNKPVDSYKAKRNDDGSVTVRSECHGKVNVETVYPADYTAGPLMMFEPGYDK